MYFTHMCTLSLRTLFHGIGRIDNTPRDRVSTRPEGLGSHPARMGRPKPLHPEHSALQRTGGPEIRISSCAPDPTLRRLLKIQSVCHGSSVLLSVEGAGERRLEPLWRRGICIYINVYMNAYGYIQASDNQCLNLHIHQQTYNVTVMSISASFTSHVNRGSADIIVKFKCRSI